jgi:hypothetical protein
MFRPLLIAAITLFVSSGLSSAALVLTINIANPSSTIITAVANNSQITADLEVNFLGGISFVSFFTANEDITVADPVGISGTWTGGGAAVAYDEMVTFNYGNPAVVAARDLSIYNVGAGNSLRQFFSTSTTAFTGSSTLDLSSFTNLPAVGTTGNVYIGYESDHGGIIGQWQVIPEPSSLLIASAGLVGFLRRRR